MYALCVFGAMNMQGFVWSFFMRYISIFIHSFIQLMNTYANTHFPEKKNPHTHTHINLSI